MEIQHFPVHYFRKIQVLLETHMNARLRPLNLTLAQCEVLFLLGQRTEQDTTLQDIAHFFNLSHATVVGFLHRLEEKGFLVSRPDPQDRRRRLIRLTDRYQTVLEQIEHHRAEMEKNLLQGLSPVQKEQLCVILEHVYHNLIQD